jgi:hypothetical protein
MASSILLVSFARVEDVARIVVVANTGVNRWGLVPHSRLFRVNRGFLFARRQWCGLVRLRPVSSRHRAFALLHRGALKKGMLLSMGLSSLQSRWFGHLSVEDCHNSDIFACPGEER